MQYFVRRELLSIFFSSTFLQLFTTLVLELFFNRDGPPPKIRFKLRSLLIDASYDEHATVASSIIQLVNVLGMEKKLVAVLVMRWGLQ